ncbi:MAG: hypothetical protein KQH57_14025 [Actinomycetales bacterium]|nr:hypothetical protein [Actinomycetales bacterium]
MSGEWGRVRRAAPPGVAQERTIHDEYASYLDGLDATGLHQWLEDADLPGADAFRAGSTVSLPAPEWATALGELETLTANGSDPGLLTPEATTASPAPVPAPGRATKCLGRNRVVTAGDDPDRATADA